jgi:serine/threonine protein kinase
VWRFSPGPAKLVNVTPSMADFEPQGKLGEGAAGVVYSALRKVDGQRVAIKVLRGEFQPGSPVHERFVREAATGARIDSPYVVRVLEHWVDAGSACIVMEFIDGPSVSARLRGGALQIPEALRIAQHVASALKAAAKKGVVHRDVKPENILLAPDGRAKLTDFGIAKDLDSSLASLTRSGQGMGTLAYLAPEQIKDAKNVEEHADVYSLGATLYHMLTGRPPFQVNTPAELLAAFDQTPPSVALLRPETPPEVVTAVEGMLEKYFLKRPSAAQVAAKLKDLRQS